MLTLSELFASIQGEGLLVGEPTTFIRFGGCNLSCSWCDAKYAVDRANSPSWSKLSPEALMVDYAYQIGLSPAICLTGGEPLIQPVGDFTYLCSLLKEKGKKLTIETAGTIFSAPIFNAMDFITVSPKLPSARQGNAGWAEERFMRILCKPYSSHVQLKFVVDDEHDTVFLTVWLSNNAAFLNDQAIPVVLVPCDVGDGDLIGRYAPLLETYRATGIKNLRIMPQVNKLLHLR